MRRRTLLIAGSIALAASLIGPTVQASITGEASGWGDHMTGYGHMGWWSSDQATDDVFEGAPEEVVTASDFAFSAAELTVVEGEPINLTLINRGSLHHDLAIPEIGVRVAAAPGQQTTAGIEIEVAGSYEFICTYPGHAEAGMSGLLKVEPNR